jgi:putative membrane protein
MWLDAILAYLHFMAIFGLFATLMYEVILLKRGVASLDVETLALTDRKFGIQAVVVLVTGALRVGFGVKGAAFYMHNPVFHLKIGLFVLAALISIAPTIAFLRWRKARRADPSWRVPEPEWQRARKLVRLEMIIIALIPLAAVIMSRGLALM